MVCLLTVFYYFVTHMDYFMICPNSETLEVCDRLIKFVHQF